MDWFEFLTPDAVTEASKDYIKQNNVLLRFNKEAFEVAQAKNDVVLLIEAYALSKNLNFAIQLGIKNIGALAQRMKMKNIDTEREGGTWRLRFTHLKVQAKYREDAPRPKEPRYNYATDAPGPSNGARVTTARPP